MAKSILIVDDSESVRQTVAFLLQDQGYDVIEARDGREALDKLDGRTINLIVCDVNMPTMDGIEFIKTVKGDGKYASYRFTPVVMLTTESNEAKKEEGKQAGVKAWLLKPLKPEVLLESIKKLIV
jgi:two-component system chemotaxis response regulator CheY